MSLRAKTPSERIGNEAMKELGSRLRELREARSWSLKRLSSESSVSVATIQKLEAGNASPSLVTFLALAEALGEPVDRLISGTLMAPSIPIKTGRLPDISVMLSDTEMHSEMAARLLVVPARKSVADLEVDRPGFFFVLDGDVRFAFHDGNSVDIHTGDALHADPDVIERCSNLNTRRSRVLHLADRRSDTKSPTELE